MNQAPGWCSFYFMISELPQWVYSFDQGKLHGGGCELTGRILQLSHLHERTVSLHLIIGSQRDIAERRVAEQIRMFGRAEMPTDPISDTEIGRITSRRQMKREAFSAVKHPKVQNPDDETEGKDFIVEIYLTPEKLDAVLKLCTQGLNTGFGIQAKLTVTSDEWAADPITENRLVPDFLLDGMITAQKFDWPKGFQARVVAFDVRLTDTPLASGRNDKIVVPDAPDYTPSVPNQYSLFDRIIRLLILLPGYIYKTIFILVFIYFAIQLFR